MPQSVTPAIPVNPPLHHSTAHAAAQPEQRTSPLPLILVCILVGLNLRPALAAIGPVVTLLQQDTGLSFSGVAWLTLLPVLAMGIGCFVTLWLRRHISLARLIQGALALLLLANLLRLIDAGSLNATLLLLTALLAGSGIAVIQATLPIVVKSLASDSARIMGFYVSAIMAGAALGAGLTPFLAQWLASWRAALAFWTVLAVVALVAWMRWTARTYIQPPATDAEIFSEPLPEQTTAQRLSRYRLMSLVATFSMAAAGYVCVLAWLPPFLIDLGYSNTEAGLMLGYLTAIEVTAGLLFPALAAGNPDRRRVLFSVLILSIGGFIWLAYFPLTGAVPLPSAAFTLASMPIVLIPLTLLGLGIGGQFPMIMIVTMDHHTDAQQAGSLIGNVQGYGYSLAAMTPLIMGSVRDQLGNFSSAWLALAIMYAAALLLCSRYNPARYPQ
ncbi:MAG: MFS transporter [Saccharospirillaceae bacterium]|nr:MFS transporter [Saccharospirillaceae bacterium]MCD8529827.1 MFS transporter [Saccharospirillaceae bacterium]